MFSRVGHESDGETLTNSSEFRPWGCYILFRAPLCLCFLPVFDEYHACASHVTWFDFDYVSMLVLLMSTLSGEVKHDYA